MEGYITFMDKINYYKDIFQVDLWIQEILINLPAVLWCVYVCVWAWAHMQIDKLILKYNGNTEA